VERELHRSPIRKAVIAVSNLFYPPESESERPALSTWDEARRIADEIELKIHLARMDVRDRWQTLRPQIQELEKRIATSGERAGKAIKKELTALRTLLQQLRGEAASNDGP
jgi:hypothetical protein